MIGPSLVPVFVAACALLAVAGVAKLRAPDPARAALASLRIPVPPVAVRALGGAEVVLGVYAAVRPGPLTAGLVAGAYGAFTLATLRLLAVDVNADCGCFGAASTVASRSHAAVCAVACAAAAVAAVHPPPGVAWIASRDPLVAVTLAVGVATAAFAAYAVFTLFPPAWSAYRSRSAQ